MNTTVVSPEEYLSTSYKPDVNYIDGHLEERNVGTTKHGDLTWYLRFLLRGLGLRAFTEARLRVAPNRYRVPDVCAYLTDPREDVLTAVPLLVAEVLSPEDRLSQVAREAKEYLAMGVPIVWILDPVDKVAYVVDPNRGLFQVGKSIATFDGSYSLQLVDIFSEEGQ